MAAPRPPNAIAVPETIDDADVLDDADIVEIDETAPPQRSPIVRPLPFGGNPGGGPPHGATPGHPPAAQAPFGQAAGPAPAQPIVRQAPFGEETAPAQRSPLAAALPFRHAKVAAATTAIPMPTEEDLRRLAQGGPDPTAAHPAGAPLIDAAARAKLEQARTVAFAMPPAMDNPAAQAPVHAASPQGYPPQTPAPQTPAPQGPVAAASTGHFGLSLEQYAALCAEVAVFPQAAEAVFAQYGLAERKDRLTADIAWQERLRSDNALMQRWQSLYLHYHEYYHRHGKR